MIASAFCKLTERWSLLQLLLGEAEPSLHMKVVNHTQGKSLCLQRCIDCTIGNGGKKQCRKGKTISVHNESKVVHVHQLRTRSLHLIFSSQLTPSAVAECCYMASGISSAIQGNSEQQTFDLATSDGDLAY